MGDECAARPSNATSLLVASGWRWTLSRPEARDTASVGQKHQQTTGCGGAGQGEGRGRWFADGDAPATRLGQSPPDVYGQLLATGGGSYLKSLLVSLGNGYVVRIVQGLHRTHVFNRTALHNFMTILRPL